MEVFDTHILGHCLVFDSTDSDNLVDNIARKNSLKSMVPKRDKSILEHLRKRHFFVRGKLMMKK